MTIVLDGLVVGELRAGQSNWRPSEMTSTCWSVQLLMSAEILPQDSMRGEALRWLLASAEPVVAAHSRL